jgi:hypothetical protein
MWVGCRRDGGLQAREVSNTPQEEEEGQGDQDHSGSDHLWDQEEVGRSRWDGSAERAGALARSAMAPASLWECWMALKGPGTNMKGVREP